MGLEFGLFVAIGFFAQIVDGALGMAFGIIAATSLIAAGTPPALASAAVHAAEVATTGVSGASHAWNGNVDWALVRRLAIPGVAGGALGAYVVVGLPEEIVKPIVCAYLALMAALVFSRVIVRYRRRWNVPLPLLGTGGAFLDAIGGGGWGPIVASTLLASGDNPRRTIGSVVAAELAVTVAVSVAFLAQLDLTEYGHIVAGLVVGGVAAAPLAGFLVRILPTRVMLVLVGTVVVCLTIVSLMEVVA